MNQKGKRMNQVIKKSDKDRIQELERQVYYLKKEVKELKEERKAVDYSMLFFMLLLFQNNQPMYEFTTEDNNVWRI